MVCLGYCSTPRNCECEKILDHLWSAEGIEIDWINGEHKILPRIEQRYKKWYGKTYQDYYDLNLKEAIRSKIMKERKELDIRQDILKDLKLNKLYWGLIGFPNDISMNIIKKTLDKIQKLKIFSDSMYSVEFYSDDGKYNPHIHLLIKPVGSYTMSKLKGQLKKLFAPYIVKHLGDVNQSDVQGKIDYLQGIKTDKKIANVDKDKEKRKQENIENFYSRGNIQQCQENPLL